MRALSCFILAVGLIGCTGPSRVTASPDVATTVTSLDLPSGPTSPQASDYRIGQGDKLRMTVFQVPDLSFEESVVDASGSLQIPMLGSVRAAGLTPAQLSAEVERQLGARYLRNPRVAITVLEAASQKVTIDGAVTKPGVYEMRGRTTLLQAVAMAEGPTRTADVESVAVFRNGEHGRMVAVFDLASIRGGQAPDPVILGDDIIVVDTSRLSVAMREVLGALPALSAFAYFR